MGQNVHGLAGSLAVQERAQLRCPLGNSGRRTQPGAEHAVAGCLERVFDAVKVLEERLAENAHGTKAQ